MVAHRVVFDGASLPLPSPHPEKGREQNKLRKSYLFIVCLMLVNDGMSFDLPSGYS